MTEIDCSIFRCVNILRTIERVATIQHSRLVRLHSTRVSKLCPCADAKSKDEQTNLVWYLALYEIGAQWKYFMIETKLKDAVGLSIQTMPGSELYPSAYGMIGRYEKHSRRISI